MARAIWSGSISFGLVSVPVKAYAAVRDHSVHFNQLEKGTGARIRHQKVSDKTGKEVSTDDIESAYELSSGKYVVVDGDELGKLRPRTTRTIDITDFVDLDQIDPIYFERTYWLAPADEAGERPYRLLLASMEQEGKAAIGTVVMRNKQYLSAIRPLDGALAMSTMRFADEVVPRADITELPKKGAKPEPKELALASQIIDSLAADWDPARYHDTYTEELRDLIKAKAKGKKIVVEDEEPSPAEVTDLMSALEASLASARPRGSGASARPQRSGHASRTQRSGHAGRTQRSGHAGRKGGTGKSRRKAPARKKSA